MTFTELSVDELDDTSALLMKAFFTQSEASQASGRAYMERLKSRSTDRDTPVSKQSALAELAAIREWGVIPASDRFAMLGKIPAPDPDRAREQGCRGHADQRISAGRAPAQCSAHHVSGREPWRTISARGCISSACEFVSAVTATMGFSFRQGNAIS